MKFLGDTSLRELVTKIKEKVVALIPTNNNQLTNGAGYITSSSANNTFVKKAGDTMTGALTIGFRSGTAGNYSFTHGSTNTASGNNTYAGGWNAVATGDSAFSSGQYVTASGKSAHAFGQGQDVAKISATEWGSLAGGAVMSLTDGTKGGTIQSTSDGAIAWGTTMRSGSILANSRGAVAIGVADKSNSIIEATEYGAVAIGNSCGGHKISASYKGSFAGGFSYNGDVVSSGNCSFAYGNTSSAEGYGSVAFGYGAHAKGGNDLVVGMNSTSTGSCTFISGTNNNASGAFSSAMGKGLKANGQFMATLGRYNSEGTNIASDTATTGDVLIVGKGTSDSNRSNAMRLTIAGQLYLQSSYSSSGADYAETTEWQDGNPNAEDRIGHFVCMIGNKMRLANSNDIRSRIGVISAEPAVNGDSFSEEWRGKYKTDIFGRKLTKIVHYDEMKDERDFIIQPESDSVEWILADDYDPTQKYIPREQRKEFDYFGMMGKLIVIDDGTCQVDGYCYPNDNGIATAESNENKGFYVMERLDENHIKILLK